MNYSEMFTWKWSTGISYKKSERIREKKRQVIDETDIFINAIPNAAQNDHYTRTSTKREEQNDKLSSRQMVIQKNINPFMETANYIEDLKKEAEFLRPKDSNIN